MAEQAVGGGLGTYISGVWALGLPGAGWVRAGAGTSGLPRQQDRPVAQPLAQLLGGARPELSPALAAMGANQGRAIW